MMVAIVHVVVYGGYIHSIFTEFLRIIFTVLELGFLQDSYIVSEEIQLREARICVIINRGVLERDVVLNVVTTDITAEGTYIATTYSVQYEFQV